MVSEDRQPSANTDRSGRDVAFNIVHQAFSRPRRRHADPFVTFHRYRI